MVRGEEGEVSELQAKEENCLGTFQVASQFNCLEFVDPDVLPEEGVTQYVYDKTQVIVIVIIVFIVIVIIVIVIIIICNYYYYLQLLLLLFAIIII